MPMPRGSRRCRLVWRQREDGVKTLRSIPEIVDAVERRAHDRGVVLTSNEKALARAAGARPTARRDTKPGPSTVFAESTRLRPSADMRGSKSLEWQRPAAAAICCAGDIAPKGNWRPADLGH
jgi:hypothetical protein